MLSKPKIKYIESLRVNKFRQKYGNFIVEGEKMAGEVLTNKNIVIENVFATETWISANIHLLKQHFSKTLTVTDAELKQISGLSTPNKVLIIAQQPTPQYDNVLIENNFSLYLDGIQDPGNMGTIMRIADWFSIPYVFCSESSVDVWNPKVVQASMGAFLRVQAFETSFEDLKKQFPKLPIFATILRGDNIFAKKMPNHGLIVVGNEGSGVSQNILAVTDFNISIPGGVGGAESLNAAVATGIVCAVLKNKG